MGDSGCYHDFHGGRGAFIVLNSPPEFQQRSKRVNKIMSTVKQKVSVTADRSLDVASNGPKYVER